MFANFFSAFYNLLLISFIEFLVQVFYPLTPILIVDSFLEFISLLKLSLCSCIIFLRILSTFITATFNFLLGNLYISNSLGLVSRVLFHFFV